MATGTYLCDECDGYGAVSMDGYDQRDPAHEDRDCYICDSTGVIKATAGEAESRCLQPWSGDVGRSAHRIRLKHVDPLTELARCRAINPKSWAYEHARRRALSRCHRLPRTDLLAGCQMIHNDIAHMRDMLGLEKAA